LLTPPLTKGQAVAEEVAAAGFDDAGFVNISTTDNIVHGQVKQAGKFSFVRIYESGHEVPFYQPLTALSIFERAITGKDIATGAIATSTSILTDGAKSSAYREGNSTIQLSILPASATYNHTTNGPNTMHQNQKMGVKRRRGLLSSGKKFKP